VQARLHVDAPQGAPHGHEIQQQAKLPSPAGKIMSSWCCCVMADMCCCPGSKAQQRYMSASGNICLLARHSSSGVFCSQYNTAAIPLLYFSCKTEG
jgi:hypothetical protein